MTPLELATRLEAVDNDGALLALFDRLLGVFERWAMAPAREIRPYVPPCALRYDEMPRDPRGKPQRLICERHWVTLSVPEDADWPDRCPAGQAEAAAAGYPA